ncbi:MAG: hypothetical protein GVY26_22595 [Bacteroidetes bacterium]|jgi:hypothetical protein|nr:hypothetical protein [Bacteroidota bacterium]
MNKRTILSLLVIAAIGSFVPSACTTDRLPEPMLSETCADTVPTYEGRIKSIIETNCAYAGCHLDGTAPGVYTSYEGLLPNIESGSFRQRVIVEREDPNRGMPPDYAPDGQPKDLTEEELELIECWLDSGYPEL